eukprot:4714129-Prymnesium_polylepis.3
MSSLRRPALSHGPLLSRVWPQGSQPKQAQGRASAAHQASPEPQPVVMSDEAPAAAPALLFRWRRSTGVFDVRCSPEDARTPLDHIPSRR